MTKITYSRDGLELQIKGHTGAAPTGEDVICAWISALEQTLLKTLLEMQREGDGKTEYEHDKPGWARIRFIPKPWVRITVTKYFDFVMTGLHLIAGLNPKNVEIEEE